MTGSPPRERPGATRQDPLALRRCPRFFVAYQLAWAVLLFTDLLAALGTAYVAACFGHLADFYGDHASKVCFVIPRARAAGQPA